MKTKIVYRESITENNKMLCDIYWSRQGDKKYTFMYSCKKIGQHFGLKPQYVPKVVRENAYLLILDCQCVDCHKNAVCHTRSELVHFCYDEWQCNDCYNLSMAQKRKEYLSKELEQEHLNAKNEQMVFEQLIRHRNYQVQNIPLLFDLSMVDKLLLIAAVKVISTSDSINKISVDRRTLLSPFPSIDKEIIKHLFESNLLLLSIDNNDDAISMKDDTGLLNIDYHKAIFDPAYGIDDLDDIVSSVKSEQSIHEVCVDTQFRHWCRKIQLGECLSYLVNISQKRDLVISINKEIRNNLQMYLEIHTVSTLCYSIYKSVEEVKILAQQPGVVISDASNIILVILDKIINRISEKNSSCYHTPRPSCLPQSVAAKIFFDDIFGIEDCVFPYTLDQIFDLLRYDKVKRKVDYNALTNAKSINCTVVVDGSCTSKIAYNI